MKNEKTNISHIFKLYGLNIPIKYINDMNLNLNNMTMTEKAPKIKNIGRNNNNNYKNIYLKGKTEDSSERNKSAFATKYTNFYSILHYKNQIKSIEKNMGIENYKLHKDYTQLNYLDNIKKIKLPLNHRKINFDIINKKNSGEKKKMVNTRTFLKLNNDQKPISCFDSKSKRNRINIKSTSYMLQQHTIKNFSKIQLDKNKLFEIRESINLPFVSKMKKKKIDINTNYFEKLISIIPQKSLKRKLEKEKTFSHHPETKAFEPTILIQKNISNKNNNIINPRSSSDGKKIISSKTKIHESFKDTAIPTRKFIFNKKMKTNNIYDMPQNNYYNENYYYYNIYPSNCGWLIKDCFNHRLKWKKCHSNNTNLYNFKWKEVINNSDEFLELGIKKLQIINHFEFHSSLSNKCNMFYNFANYCEENNLDIFKYVPFTIILDVTNFSLFYSHRRNFKEMFDNIEDFIFDTKSISNKIFDRRKISYKTLFPMKNPKFGLKLYCEISKSHYDGKNLWIVKVPNLNRGRGVKIFNNYKNIISYIKKIAEGKITESELYNIKDIENSDSSKKQEKNACEATNEKECDLLFDDQDYIYQSSKIIIQKYIEKPFLYKGRKCDIRIWVLITHSMKVYVFKEGHLKASSLNYNKDDFDSFIHITNYSLQKYNKLFSKYEKGNEISFQTFQEFIDENTNKFNFREEIFPKFIEIIKLSTLSVKNKINMNNLNYCFEIFGYDFMMDEDKNVYLIEINTNPGLEISSDLIAELVPRMIDNALLLTVDQLFPTEYSKECLNEKGEYKSKFHVNGYKDDENMWEFVCDLKKHPEKEKVKKKKVKIKKIKN